MDMSFVWIEIRPGVSNLGCDTVAIESKQKEKKKTTYGFLQKSLNYARTGPYIWLMISSLFLG